MKHSSCHVCKPFKHQLLLHPPMEPWPALISATSIRSKHSHLVTVSMTSRALLISGLWSFVCLYIHHRLPIGHLQTTPASCSSAMKGLSSWLHPACPCCIFSQTIFSPNCMLPAGETAADYGFRQAITMGARILTSFESIVRAILHAAIFSAPIEVKLNR